jgi:iron complex outermembrane receptor protein
MRDRGFIAQLASTVLLFVAAPSAVFAQEPNTSSPANQPQQLKQLSIEELAGVRVTSAAKRVERLSDVAAAITVIQGDDIRRAGVTSLPEALRLIDAMHVAAVYGPGYAITSRGFNISTTNKMLVLIDGRTVYSPLFSGVFWDVQDIVLADIDRIEVIRGPGGTLWGANAVNGVVNIITKPASETQGAQVVVVAGQESRPIASAQFGGGKKGGTAFRIYGKFRADDQHVFKTGAPGQDDVQFGQSGFRVDSDQRKSNFWTFQGDAYVGRVGLFDRADTKLSGGNLLGRFTKRWSPTSQFQTQIYYDRTNRRVDRQYRAATDTLDVDSQQQIQLGERHRIVFGAGFRYWHSDDVGDGPGFYFDPEIRTSRLLNIFAEDEVALVPGRLSVIAGTKVERNTFTGVEWLPSVRLRFTPTERQTLWTAASRAVRMPTRFDEDLRIVLPNGALLITGNSDFKSENVTAYEGGYRVRPADWVSFDLAVFANRYDDLRSQELPSAAGKPVVLANGLDARTSGVEVSASVSFTSWWQAHASYSFLHEKFSRDADSRDNTGGASEANDPRHLFSIRTSIDLPRRVQADAMVRHVSSLPSPAVDAYTELSARLGWELSSHIDLSLIGQNLLHDRHEEFAAGTPRELFERGLSLRGTFRF